MKERFYAGKYLSQDLEFCDIVSELEKNPSVLILYTPEKFLIHEMVYDNRDASKRYDTGKTHIGYDYHYVFFLYRNTVFYVQSGDYYPFEDENFPGRFCFMAYRRIGFSQMIQSTFFERYENLDSVIQWVNNRPRFLQIKDALQREVCRGVSESLASKVVSESKRIAGNREKAILNSYPIIKKSETWSEEHRVVHVITGDGDNSMTFDDSGHRDSFDFDLVTGRICG